MQGFLRVEADGEWEPCCAMLCLHLHPCAAFAWVSKPIAHRSRAASDINALQ